MEVEPVKPSSMRTPNDDDRKIMAIVWDQMMKATTQAFFLEVDCAIDNQHLGDAQERLFGLPEGYVFGFDPRLHMPIGQHHPITLTIPGAAECRDAHESLTAVLTAIRMGVEKCREWRPHRNGDVVDWPVLTSDEVIRACGPAYAARMRVNPSFARCTALLLQTQNWGWHSIAQDYERGTWSVTLDPIGIRAFRDVTSIDGLVARLRQQYWSARSLRDYGFASNNATGDGDNRNSWMDRMTQTKSPNQTDISIGILVPLGEEYEYLNSVWKTVEERQVDGQFYYVLEAPLSKVRAVVVVMDEMGLLSAGLEAERLVKQFSVSCLVLLGVAGSLSKDVALGDVVVGSQVVQYEHRSKAVPAENSNAWNYELAPTYFKTNAQVLKAINNFPRHSAGKPFFAQWQDSADSADAAAPEELAGNRVSLHVVDIASGDTVGAASAFKEFLKGQNRKFGAIEMEAAGMATSIEKASTHVYGLVIRGISDGADETKTETDALGVDGKILRRFAVTNAANYLDTLLCWPHFRTVVGCDAAVRTTTDDRLKLDTVAAVPQASASEPKWKPIANEREVRWIGDQLAFRDHGIYAPVLELHLALGEIQPVIVTRLEELRSTLPRRTREASFFGESDQLEIGGNSTAAWVWRRESTGGYVHGSRRDNKYRGVVVHGDGDVSVFDALPTDGMGALTDSSDLGTRLGWMLELAVELLPEDAGDITVAACLAPLDRLYEGDPASVGGRTSGHMRMSQGQRALMMPTKVIAFEDLKAFRTSVVREITASLLASLRDARS